MKVTNEQTKTSDINEESYSWYNTIIGINSLNMITPRDVLNDALNILLGHIDNKLIYMFCDFNALNQISTYEDKEKGINNKDISFYVVQLNPYLYAIPNYVDDNNKLLQPAHFMKTNGEIDYDFVNSIHRDLNNIMKIYDVPVDFKGIKEMKNGEMIAIKPFRCTLIHRKLDLDVLNNLIGRIYKHNDLVNKLGVAYTHSKEYDREIDNLIDSIFRYNDIDSMTFMEYDEFVLKTIDTSLFNVSKFMKL